MSRAVIVGAGHAGAEFAFALRRLGFAGSILMLGEEEGLPYQRPPLSKAFLCGQMTADELLIKPASAYAKGNIEFRAGCRVARIDRGARTLVLDGGERVAYDKLAIATGGRARELPGPASGAGNCHTLRTRADVERIRPAFLQGRRLVIIGAGYVGLEVAASAISRGMRVTVIERDARVMARVAPEPVTMFYQHEHERAGVHFELSAVVERMHADAAGTTIESVHVRRSDGSHTVIGADLVLVGIGMVPNTELALECGLSIDNGIVVDESGLTSDPDIVALGDCTSQQMQRLDARIRLESVSNALDQARAAAALICGRERSAAPPPWFWSDQYDLKLQMVGLSAGHDQVVVRGEPASRSFSVFFGFHGELISAICVNASKDFVFARRALGLHSRVNPETLRSGALPELAA